MTSLCVPWFLLLAKQQKLLCILPTHRGGETWQGGRLVP
jgi:hypothetical protein